MDIQKQVNPDDYEIGVIIARFQVHELHEAHQSLIRKVAQNHKKVIIFLGIPTIPNTKKNPLDFATRRAMVQEFIPDAVILPLKDQRSNAKWSYILDNEIKVPFGERTTLIYGGRDSFIPYYEGAYQTTELVTDTFASGTEVRNQVSRELRNSADFRAGIIHATYARRPVTWSTVDVCPYNKEGQILLGKKPNESVWRFVGGFVDRTDLSDESAAKRELAEEAGSIEVSSMEYVTSQKVNDWRYAKSEDGIMTRLFITEYLWGRIEPSDDISELKWFDLETFKVHNNIIDMIMPEHHDLMRKLVDTKFDKIKNSQKLETDEQQ
jgi:bifunctional NMN adenylyltransferase/nudix hydrolase